MQSSDSDPNSRERGTSGMESSHVGRGTPLVKESFTIDVNEESRKAGSTVKGSSMAMFHSRKLKKGRL